jgi:DNA-binding response OmpR family regulator
MTDQEGLSMVEENEIASGLQSHSSPEKVRVLVVDDRIDIVRTCAILLQHAGFEVRTATSGRDALKAAVEFHPRIALLDIGLPDLDGFEVARRIRADLTFTEMTLIAITAYGTQESRSRAEAAGFDH